MNAQLERDGTTAPVTALLSGIVEDIQTLTRQQLTLIQVEFKNDLRRTKEAMLPLVVGGIVGVVGGIILAIAAAHGLVHLWPNLTLPGAFGIVGLILCIAGVGLALCGRSKFSTFSPTPDKSVEGLQENLQWKTKTTS